MKKNRKVARPESRLDVGPSGWTDDFTLKGASGWLASSHVQGGVRITVNGFEVATIPAGSQRPDLADEGFPGAHNFVLHWELERLGSYSAAVALTVANGSRLPKGRRYWCEGRLASKEEMPLSQQEIPVGRLASFAESVRVLNWETRVAEALTTRCSSTDDEAFVWLMYKLLLRRNVDTLGLRDSCSELRGGGVPARRALVVRILGSDEGRSKWNGVVLDWFLPDPYGIRHSFDRPASSRAGVPLNGVSAMTNTNLGGRSQ